MAADVKIDIAAEFTGKKAFKQADTATQKLTNGVKKLAGAIGLAYGTTAIIAYGKASVRAFAADDKAARTLSKTLSNLGLAFADPEIKTFISTLERQSGVLDDVLRPAYQKLVTTTGDYRRSQTLLETALDLSAQSGVDLLTVSNDIGKAFVGNTRGLVKYNLGLNKTQLAAMSFEEVLARITKISAGQAALAADTYAGKLDKLTVASENAKEVLGGALLDAIIKLGGGDVDKTTDKIDKLSTSLASLIRLATGTSDMSLKDILQGVDYKFGFIPVNKVKAPRSKSPAGTFMRNQAEIKAAAEAKRLAAEQAKSGKALLKSQQDQLKLAKAKAVFDLQKINIEAALKGKISEEDKIRLNLLKAIEEENIDNAEKYQKALDKSQEKTKELADLLATVKAMEVKDPFSTWSIDPLTASINALTESIGGVGTAITARGTEWSSFTSKVAETTIQPNLKEFSSSFTTALNDITSSFSTAVTGLNTLATSASKTASDAAATATATANAALTSTSSTATAAIGSSTTSATDATVVAIATSGSATTDTIIETSQAAADALDLLYSNSTTALANAATTTATDFMAASAAALAKLQEILAAEAAAYASAAAAASAQAAADAADLAGAGNAGSNVSITVNTGIGDPNAIAEAIAEVIREAGSRGTLDVAGFG